MCVLLTFCQVLTKPPPAGKCKNSGWEKGGKCTCPWGYEGTLCEKSTIPQGWDISRPTGCNNKPLISKDSPMQATWIRMQLGKPDNVQVFRPFQYGPLSKVKFFNQMMIGLDTPRYMAGAELQGSLSASVTFSAWLKMGNFVIRAALIFSVGLSKSKTVDPTTMLVGLLGGTDEHGNLRHENKTAVVEALYRQGAQLRKVHGNAVPHMRHLLADDSGVHELDSATAFELDEFGRHPSQPGFETQELEQNPTIADDEVGGYESAKERLEQDNTEFGLSAEQHKGTTSQLGQNMYDQKKGGYKTASKTGVNQKYNPKTMKGEIAQPTDKNGKKGDTKAYAGYAMQSKHQGDSYNNARSTKKGK